MSTRPAQSVRVQQLATEHAVLTAARAWEVMDDASAILPVRSSVTVALTLGTYVLLNLAPWLVRALSLVMLDAVTMDQSALARLLTVGAMKSAGITVTAAQT